jgi:hypothetical protein
MSAVTTRMTSHNTAGLNLVILKTTMREGTIKVNVNGNRKRLHKPE